MRLRKYVDRTLEIFLVLIMCLLVVDVVWQVASRYLFANPSSFTDELAGFLLVWVGIAGAAYVKGKNEHLAIDILHGKLAPATRIKLLIFINLLVTAFCLSIMVAGGSWLVYTRFVMDQISAAMHIPIGFVYLIVPVCGLIMSYYSLDDIKNLYREWKTSDHSSHGT
jgi:TRAP-type C4-dicarboxylate transport system permease small subunit